MRRRVALPVLVVLVAVVSGIFGSIALAGARAPGSAAGIVSTSLRQSGQSLQWRVDLASRISADELATGRRTLCLLVGRRHIASLCLAAPGGRGAGLGLAWTPATGRMRARPVPGAVVRTSPTALVITVSPSALGLRWQALDWQTRSTVRATGCPTAVGGGATCSVVRPAAARRVALHVPVLVGCVATGASIRYSGPPRHEIALTFDDGPWPDPPSIDFVRELARLHVPGTFFEIGDQIHEYDPTGAVERAMLADGDMIGNHTWTHPDMLNLSPAAQTSELRQTNAAIRHATGFTPCLWRPPYGAIDPALEGLARGIGLLSVYWDIDPRDWSLPGESSIIHTVLAQARDGGIVEMHFGGGPRYETLDALPTIVADLRARGYRFVNLVQMFGLREVWR